MKSAIERFNMQFMPVTESGCWLWLGPLTIWGYGQFYLDGKVIRSHRVAWLLFRGPILENKHVLHHCDIASCVNPDHLYLGTHLDNMRDMALRRRSASMAGIKNPKARLTEEQVSQIRQSKISGPILAAKFGVTRTQINRIKNGNSWRVPELVS